MAIIDLNAKYAAPDSSDNDSKKTMIYTSDTGDQYAVKIGENLGEVMGFDDYTTSSIAPTAPEGLRMRTVSFCDATGKIKGQYPVGKPTEDVFAEGGVIIVARKGKATGVTCQVLGAQGEKRQFPRANDTGQQSGDIE